MRRQAPLTIQRSSTLYPNAYLERCSWNLDVACNAKSSRYTNNAGKLHECRAIKLTLQQGRWECFGHAELCTTMLWPSRTRRSACQRNRYFASLGIFQRCAAPFAYLQPMEATSLSENRKIIFSLPYDAPKRRRFIHASHILYTAAKSPEDRMKLEISRVGSSARG